jgi:aminobenzoyl-glutamate transport protein
MTEPSASISPPKKTLLAKALGWIERGGNALPHPVAIFALFALVTIVVSWGASLAGVEAVHPATGKTIRVVNLMSVSGLHQILEKLVVNFTSFAPLGTVLVAMLGIGVAESSGLLSTGLRMLVLAAPKRLLTFALVLVGVLSNMASDVGYVVLIPLGGMIFLAAGRHPIAGIAATFAGVSSGFSANLMLGTIDPLLAGLTQEAAQIMEPGYQVNPACNYYFMAASTVLVALVGTWVTERIVIPRLGKYEGDEQPEKLESLTPDQKRGLKFAAVAAAVFIALVLWGTVPASGFLRHPQTGGLLRSPFMSGIVALIFLAATFVGLAYGIGARTIRKEADVINGMTLSMKSLGLYLVICFFAAQFVAYFRWTNLGLILAIKGAGLIQASGLGEVPLLIALVLLAAFLNLFVGSASAKWAIMAPVFVPMFMLLGYSPALIQATYRIGDSTTNIITPVMAFFPLVVVYMERYRKDAGIGTVISTMLPYSVALLLLWIPLLIVWVLLRLPLGPGAKPFF